MLRSGFFNSRSHDKLYYNSDISRLFNSLIIDGVFQNIGDKFIARAGSGMQVIVPSGMAYFNSTWLFSDSDYIVPIDTAPIVAGFTRIDGVFLKMGPEDDTGDRENTIYYMAGSAGSQGVTKPVPTPTYGEVYVPICYITVATGTTEITASMIENAVGLSATPFITGILQTTSIQEIFNQWAAQWNDWINQQRSIGNQDLSDFETWISEREAELTATLNAFDTWIDNKKTETDADIDEWIHDDQEMWSAWFDSVKEDLATVEVGELKNKVDAIIGMHVVEDTLYLPNTAASVSDNVLSIGLPY